MKIGYINAQQKVVFGLSKISISILRVCTMYFITIITFNSSYKMCNKPVDSFIWMFGSKSTHLKHACMHTPRYHTTRSEILSIFCTLYIQCPFILLAAVASSANFVLFSFPAQSLVAFTHINHGGDGSRMMEVVVQHSWRTSVYKGWNRKYTNSDSSSNILLYL